MTTKKSSGPRVLPLTGKLTIPYVSSCILALLVAATAIAGFIFKTSLYPTDRLVKSFIPMDTVNIILGLPILFVSMALTARGRLIGLLGWTGALFFILYNYVTSALGVPFGALFIPYLLIVSASAYTILGIVMKIDGDAVRRRLAGFVPPRVFGGIMIGLALFTVVRQVAFIVSTLASRAPVDALDLALWIDDLAVVGPAFLACGILLWMRHSLGYVMGAGMFLQFGALVVGLIPTMVYQASFDDVPVDIAGIVIVLIMGIACFVPFAFFVRGSLSAE